MKKYKFDHKYKFKCIDCHFRTTKNNKHVCTKINGHYFLIDIISTCANWRRRINNDLE